MSDIPPGSTAGPDSLGAEHIPTAAGARGRVVRGMLAKVYFVTVVFAQQVVLVPLFLHAWGPELYRDWLTIVGAASLLCLADAGLNAYFSNKLLMAWSRGEKTAFFRTLRIGVAHYAVLLGVLIPLALAGAWFLPWDAWLRISSVDHETAVAVLLLLGSFMIIGIPSGMVISIYRAHGMLGTDVMVASTYYCVPVVLTAAGLVLGAGPVAIAMLHVVAHLAFWTAIVWRQKRRFPDLSFRPAVPSGGELRETAAIAPYYAIVPISAAFVIQVTLLLVAGLGAEVVLFATMRTLTGFARTVSDQIGQVVGIELARRYAQGGAAARLYLLLGRLQGAINGALCGLILVLGPPFAEIWTLGKVPMDLTMFAVLLAVVALSAPSQSAERLLANINRPRGLATAFVVRGLTAVAAAAALIPWLGALGAAIAVLISDVVVLGTLLPRAAAAAAGVPPLQQIRTAHAAAVVAFMAGTAAAYGITAITGTGGLAPILAAACVWCMLAAPPLWFLALDAGTRRWFADAVRRRLGAVS